MKSAIDRSAGADQRSLRKTGAKMRAGLLAAILSGALLGPAAAQSLDRQWAWCRDDVPDRLIRACTAVIRSGRENPENLARAFFNRGRAWADKTQYDRAVQDFDQALRLDPNYPDAYNSRGVAYSGMGQTERAIQDFDQAIKLDPNYAIAMYNRALAAQTLGHTDEANQYFAKARDAGPRLVAPKE
jgi:tetratricopeptide (TPR) repeat protein